MTILRVALRVNPNVRQVGGIGDVAGAWPNICGNGRFVVRQRGLQGGGLVPLP